MAALIVSVNHSLTDSQVKGNTLYTACVSEEDVKRGELDSVHSFGYWLLASLQQQLGSIPHIKGEWCCIDETSCGSMALTSYCAWDHNVQAIIYRCFGRKAVDELFEDADLQSAI